MSNALKFRVLAALVTAFAASPAEPLPAQSFKRVSNIRADVTLAETLHTQAMTLLTDTRRQKQAAILLERAAALRASDDPTSIRDLLLAGKLYTYANDSRTARATLERAAARALEFGDDVTAAHAYVDAAFVALRLGDLDSVRELTASAERVSKSYAVDDTHRAEILVRINPAKVAAAVRDTTDGSERERTN